MDSVSSNLSLQNTAPEPGRARGAFNLVGPSTEDGI